MRLADRLTRLEQARAADPRMTVDEIEAAAVRYEAELREDGVPGGGSVQGAMSSWRQLVDQAAEPWLQRVWAGMSPMDLYV